MQVRTRKNSQATVVGVSGPTARAELPRLCRALRKAICAGPAQVEIDLSKAEDVEFAFAQVVISASQTAAINGCGFRVRDGADGHFDAVLQSLGARDALTFMGEEPEEGASND